MSWKVFKLPSTKNVVVGADSDENDICRGFVLGRITEGDRLFYEIERELREQEALELDDNQAKQLEAKEGK